MIQDDEFNRSPIRTVVVCELTSVLRRANDPGNVLLAPGEGSLEDQTVLNVSRIITVNKTDLGEKIDALDPNRMREVMNGIRLVLWGEVIDS